MIGPIYLTQSFLQTEQSESDQDDVRMVVPKIASNSFVKRSNIAERKTVNGSADQNKNFVPDGRKAVDGSANQNLQKYFSEIGVEYVFWKKEGIQCYPA